MATTVFAGDTLKEACYLYCERGADVKSDREQGRQACGQERWLRRKVEIHVHVQLVYCIYRREGQSVGSEVVCSTALVVKMPGVF